MKLIEQNLEAAKSSLRPAVAEDHSDALLARIVQQFAVRPDSIETILPCSSFQCKVLDWAAKNGSRQAIGHVVYDIPSNVDVMRLSEAWGDVVSHTVALRTRTFSTTSGDHYQAVLRDNFRWAQLDQPQAKETVIEDEAAAAATEAQCNRYVLLNDPNTGQKQLIWTFSHALVDHALQKRMIGKVLSVYKGCRGAQRTNGYVKTSPNPPDTNTNHLQRFWEHYFRGMDASAFPTLPSTAAVPRPTAEAEHRFSYPCSTKHELDKTVVCQTALAVLLARYTGAPEALFGFVSERSAVHEYKKIDQQKGVVRIIRFLN